MSLFALLLKRGSHAGLNEVLSDTGGVALIASPEGRGCLDPSFPHRLQWDAKSFLKFLYLLEAATGGEYLRLEKRRRPKQRKAQPTVGRTCHHSRRYHLQTHLHRKPYFDSQMARLDMGCYWWCWSNFETKDYDCICSLCYVGWLVLG